MKLHNTLTHSIQDFVPLDPEKTRLYSCGPTVYNHIHIGNLRAFIMADTLRRVLALDGSVTHVMNFTDVDDKTIRSSASQYPDMSAEEALSTLTQHYEQIFRNDMDRIGNDLTAMTFIRATESIDDMRQLITNIYDSGFAYLGDDGVYFSIEKYRASGKTYGQLLHLDSSNTSDSRINNDEYDKDSIHDFALWKIRKEGEPAWEFNLGDTDITGRPGWHIECSAMSHKLLGQPFDIHTGGVDLIFPHHENEIAQSTAGLDNKIYATVFVHNEHLLVEGKKMSKSLGNFYVLSDLVEKGYDPLAFRLLALQSHYRNQTNFSWDNLTAAGHRLNSLRNISRYRYQAVSTAEHFEPEYLAGITSRFTDAMQDDLNTPEALAAISSLVTKLERHGLHTDQLADFVKLLEVIDGLMGLSLLVLPDISNTQQKLLAERQTARDQKDWGLSDKLRDQLNSDGIVVKDMPYGQIWSIQT